MQNPNQAVERIKNHLAYKLGQAMINYKCNGGGYCHLIKKLYQITKQHKKEKIIYKSTIQVFPSLQYPKLEFCPDYNEALKCKFHLSYLLGEALIKAHKNWYKGGYLFLFKDIKKAKKEFKSFKEFFDELGLNSSTIFNNLANNKKTFLKECQKIQNILKTHQDYKAIIDNIFHNFNYFIQNFTLIEGWLLSNDFYEKYKKENHPYPSLMDPKKLNDENEVINYKNIPAELAWKMNLPLPDNYEFIFLFNSCSGSEAMYHFFYLCDIETRAYSWYNGNEIFKLNYTHVLNNQFSAICMPTIINNHYEKNFFLLNKKCNIFFIARDPISIIKTAINHIDNIYTWKTIQNNLLYKNITHKNYSFNNLFPKILYAYSNSYKPKVEDIVKLLDNYQYYYTLNERLTMLKKITKNIICINFEDIYPKHIFYTLNKLSNELNFTKPNEKYRFVFESKINTYEGLTHLPVTIHIFNIKISITTPFLFTLNKNNLDRYENITNMFFQNDSILNNIIIICDKNDINNFLESEKWTDFKNYVISYLNALKQYIIKIKTNLVTEQDILAYFQKNKQLAFKFRQYINKNITFIKKNHPHYIASWKYYQEFEKMCEELD